MAAMIVHVCILGAYSISISTFLQIKSDFSLRNKESGRLWNSFIACRWSGFTRNKSTSKLSYLAALLLAMNSVTPLFTGIMLPL